MAWLNEEERALGKGKFAPYVDYRMGARAPVEPARSFPKYTPETGEFDRTLASTANMYNTYAKYQQEAVKSEKEAKDNALLNAYAMSLNDIRGQLSGGQINASEFTRRERQLLQDFINAGANASDLNSIRSGFGGQDIQKAEAAGYAQAAKNKELIDKERAEDIARQNEFLKTADYSTRMAYADYAQQLTASSQQAAAIFNAPDSVVSPAQKELYSKMFEQTRVGKVFFTTQNTFKNIVNRNPNQTLTPVIVDEMENAAVEDLMMDGWDEPTARFSVKTALQGMRSMADANVGAITDRTKYNQTIIDSLEAQNKMNLWGVAPLTMSLSGISPELRTVAVASGKEIKSTMNEEMAAVVEKLKEMEPATKASMELLNNGITPTVLQDSSAKRGAVNMATESIKNGVVTYAPDMAAAAYSVGLTNFNAETFKQDKGGVVNMTPEEMATSAKNIENFRQLWLSGNTILQSQAQEQLKTMCKDGKDCFEAGEKVIKEFVKPNSELMQAATFLQESIMNKNLRLKSDGTLALAESSGFMQGVATTFYKRQYLQNLETLNKALLQEPDKNTRAWIAKVMFGTNLEPLGLTPTLDEGLIKNITSGAYEYAGKGTAKLGEFVRKNFNPTDEELLEQLRSGDRSFNRVNATRLEEILSSDVAGEVAKGTAEKAVRDVYDRLALKDESIKQLPTYEASFKKTFELAFPSIEMTDDNEELYKETREAFKEKKQLEKELGYLYQRQSGYTDSATGTTRTEDWSDEIAPKEERLIELNKTLYRNIAKLTPGFKEDDGTLSTNERYLHQYAREFGVNANQVAAILQRESEGNPDAVSEKGAKGLMQLMPKTFEECKRELKLPADADIFDPETNIRAGVYYFSKMMRKFNGDVHKALAAYNWGPGNVSTAVATYGKDWYEGARTKGIKVTVDGKRVTRYLPKETIEYIKALGDIR